MHHFTPSWVSWIFFTKITSRNNVRKHLTDSRHGSGVLGSKHNPTINGLLHKNHMAKPCWFTCMHSRQFASTLWAICLHTESSSPVMLRGPLCDGGVITVEMYLNWVNLQPKRWLFWPQGLMGKLTSYLLLLSSAWRGHWWCAEIACTRSHACFSTYTSLMT